MWALAAAIASCLPRAAAALEAYSLREAYVGPDFFSRWDFFTEKDPSNGAVEYVSEGVAGALGMIRAVTGHVYVGVSREAVSAGTGRKSVRLHSRSTYSRGLFVAMIDHMPEGCATWPALWMYGEDEHHPWPAWGELDIVEMTHGMSRVLTTLHTGPDCQQSWMLAGTDFTGTWDAGEQVGVAATNCFVNATGQFPNQGCAQVGPADSAGTTFNSAGGGTFAAEWDPDMQRIRSWFWPMGSEPADVLRRQPDPDTWGTPYSFFSLAPDVCAAEHLANMRLVLNVNLCGDRGGSAYALTCPDIARTMECREYVETLPDAASQAYWSIRALDVYQRGTGSWLSWRGLLMLTCLLLVGLVVLLLFASSVGGAPKLMRELTFRGCNCDRCPEEEALWTAPPPGLGRKYALWGLPVSERTSDSLSSLGSYMQSPRQPRTIVEL